MWNSYFCVTPKNQRLTKKALSIVCFYNVTWVKKTFKRSCFRNISNFHNGFAWSPSRSKGHFLNELRVSFKEITDLKNLIYFKEIKRIKSFQKAETYLEPKQGSMIELFC